MKLPCNRATVLAVISFVFLLAATSCKKSNNSSSGSGISATIGSKSWSAAASATTGIYVSSEYQFQIGAAQIVSGDTTAVILYFGTPFTVGRPMNSDTTFVDINYIDSKTLDLYDGGNEAGWSILTVTSYDSTNRTVGGTFNGVLYNLNGSDSLVISNGKFSTGYTLN
ncbi:MAG TPA: hypothetical protein VL978_08675 [Puia sp.]|nr:hypothetical protein [Puia sp.]